MARDKTDKTDKTPAAMPAKQAADEWGLPDWRHIGAYGDVASWDFCRWRWEFFRRREDVREIFDMHAEAIYENKVSNNVPPFDLTCGTGRMLRPEEPGFVVDGYRAGGPAYTPLNYKGRGFLFGYALGVPNPRISEQPHQIIRAILDSKDTLTMTIGRGSRLVAGECQALQVMDGEVAIAFNIDRPLEPQLKLARESLRSEQIKRCGKLQQDKKHAKKWLGYLRALDARESGLTWAEMAHSFFELGLLDRHKNDSGGYCEPPPQAARDMWNAADRLRFNF